MGVSCVLGGAEGGKEEEGRRDGIGKEGWRGGGRGEDVLKAASMTLISVAVVSSPVNAHQSFTTRPAPITSDPRFTVPAYRTH